MAKEQKVATLYNLGKKCQWVVFLLFFLIHHGVGTETRDFI
jgi:hypothetical protein